MDVDVKEGNLHPGCLFALAHRVQRPLKSPRPWIKSGGTVQRLNCFPPELRPMDVGSHCKIAFVDLQSSLQACRHALPSTCMWSLLLKVASS